MFSCVKPIKICFACNLYIQLPHHHAVKHQLNDVIFFPTFYLFNEYFRGLYEFYGGEFMFARQLFKRYTLENGAIERA